MIKKILSVLIIFFLFFEVGSRIALTLLFESSFSKPSNIIYTYYPELKQLKDYHYDENKENVLVLGGSVVYNDSVLISGGAHGFLNMEVDEYYAQLCAIDKLLPKDQFNVLSLSFPGHNSLDSKYKYEYCKNQQFDFMFLYHGINDLRTNNIEAAKFNNNYRHIEFYDDLHVIRKHKEIDYTTIPFTIHWLIHSIKKKGTKKDDYIPKEIFFGLLTGNPEPFIQYGDEIKSKNPFLRNIEEIIQMATKRNETIILTTYAWNLPEEYTLKKFFDKQLDVYDAQLFPVEFYGQPEHIRKGIKLHNSIIKSLATKYDAMRILDFEAKLPKTKDYFNDVCHLNQEGCSIMAKELSNVILWQNKNNSDLDY